MNNDKIQKLFNSARKEEAPRPDGDFSAQVMRAVRSEAAPEPASVWGEVGELFPRLAVAAALVIGLCVAADFCASAIEGPDLTSGVAQLSEQWFFATKGL